MITRSGERQVESGKEYKKNTGSSPNGVANSWLARHRGTKIKITFQSDSAEMVGVLLGFDAYSLEIGDSEGSFLVFKGPGLVVEGAE